MVAVADDEKIGDKFLGNRVIGASMLDSLSFDRILISSLNSTDVVVDKILEKGISREKIVMIE
jgi:hypothetical protein